MSVINQWIANPSLKSGERRKFSKKCNNDAIGCLSHLIRGQFNDEFLCKMCTINIIATHSNYTHASIWSLRFLNLHLSFFMVDMEL